MLTDYYQFFNMNNKRLSVSYTHKMLYFPNLILRLNFTPKHALFLYLPNNLEPG